MLTKSNYLLGLQCPKLLWIIKNQKERIPAPDKIAEAKFYHFTIKFPYFSHIPQNLHRSSPRHNYFY